MPILSVIVPNAKAVKTAPALPEAAAMPKSCSHDQQMFHIGAPSKEVLPCAEPRTRVGKTSTGIKKVVAFGPVFKNNCDRVNKVIRPPVEV